mgnify:CR=1 FL=1|jgi:hypothetical protein
MLDRSVLIFLLLTLIRCSEYDSSTAQVPESLRKQIESDVINRFHAMIKYAEAGELENILKHFDPEGPGSYIDGPTRFASLQEMVVHYRATWQVARQDYGVPDTKIHVLSPTHVLLTSTSTLNTTRRDGVIFQPRPWAVSTLWVLKEGEWFIHSFHQFEGDLKPVEQNDKK